MRSCQEKPGDLLRLAARACFVPAALMLAGCERYQSTPLVPEEIAASVSRARAFPDGETDAGIPLTFERAAEILARHGPTLKEARAAYETSLAVAEIKTPLSNPSLEIGPNFGFGNAVDSRRIQPFGSIGFAIPTGSRLRDQDALNRSVADGARVEWVLRHRESFLTLRERYARLVLARRRLEDARDLLKQGMVSAEAARAWAAAGQIPALDASLLVAEAEKAGISVSEAERDLVEAESSLAALLGVHPDHFLQVPPASLPEVSAGLPGLGELQGLLVAHHPDLARLRARYAVAEGALRLEIARQYPDLSFGAAWSGEVGESKEVLGLPLGLALPVFDRNRQGIAEAKGRREEIRVRYETAMNRLISALEETRRSWELAAGKRHLAVDVLLSQTQRNTELARKAVAAGISSPVQLLEAQQAHREARAGAFTATQEAWTAYFRSEQAVGCPLSLFPGEPENLAPPIPFNEEGRSR